MLSGLKINSNTPMNQRSENETDAIRSDIDTTRQRMDNTLDALGERLQGRHLLDEIIGFFRSDPNGEGKVAQFREKVSQSASSAAHAVADTVKANPMPALLIGAGVVWMVYASQRKNSNGGRDYQYEYDDEETGGMAGRSSLYDPDASYDRPLDYPAGTTSERSFGDEETGFTVSGNENAPAGILATGESKLEQVKEKASGATRQVKEKIAAAGQQVRETTRAIGERAREIGTRAQESARHAYTATRERVVTTADQHPIEVGLACLAAGVAAGLALPTPPPVNRLAGPAMDRIRQRTRDAGAEILEKGKRVANAAGAAIKSEAEAQGLSIDRLREKSGAVASRAKNAVAESAQREGILPGNSGERSAQTQGGTGQPSFAQGAACSVESSI
jgi:hypothetical protein